MSHTGNIKKRKYSLLLNLDHCCGKYAHCPNMGSIHIDAYSTLMNAIIYNASDSV